MSFHSKVVRAKINKVKWPPELKKPAKITGKA